MIINILLGLCFGVLAVIALILYTIYKAIYIFLNFLFQDDTAKKKENDNKNMGSHQDDIEIFLAQYSHN